jgi:diaminohydroxyphosphoribosylaminopyrimidine deaminase/5-amino-6-(5-phosphoribosylamino)uracil reductase
LADGDAFVPALRVVLDTGLATPAGAHVLDGTAPTLVLHAPDARRAAHFGKVECAAIPVRDNRIDLPAALTLLAQRGVNELQVEAGATVCGALFAQGLVDESLLYVAPTLLGDTARPLLALAGLESIASALRLRMVDQRRIGDDWRLLLR